MGGGIRVYEEAEDLVPLAIASDVAADLLDNAGVITTERHRIGVLDTHLGEHPCGNRVVDRVHRRSVNTNEHLVVGRGRRR